MNPISLFILKKILNFLFIFCLNFEFSYQMKKENRRQRNKGEIII